MSASRETLRIVLVENDPNDLFFLERALDKGGFTRPLVHLHDGMEAMHYFEKMASGEEAVPDILLTDLKMPRMDGIDLLQWLRNHPALKQLPVIVLTSSSESVDMRNTTRLGIFKFLTKQVHYENVISALNQFILAMNLNSPSAAGK